MKEKYMSREHGPSPEDTSHQPKKSTGLLGKGIRNAAAYLGLGIAAGTGAGYEIAKLGNDSGVNESSLPRKQYDAANQDIQDIRQVHNAEMQRVLQELAEKEGVRVGSVQDLKNIDMYRNNENFYAIATLADKAIKIQNKIDGLEGFRNIVDDHTSIK